MTKVVPDAVVHAWKAEAGETQVRGCPQFGVKHKVNLR